MTKTNRYCDCCEKNITEEKDWVGVHAYTTRLFLNGERVNAVDLCARCDAAQSKNNKDGDVFYVKNQKVRVNAVEVMTIKTRLREINHLEFEDIEWVDADGCIIPTDQDAKDRFAYTGLCNSDFVECIIYGDGEMVAELKKLPKPS